MIQEFKDEILDTSSQPDSKPRYRIRDNDGEVLQDDVQIEVKTPVIQEGTIINKDSFNPIYAKDNYKRLEVQQEDTSYETTANYVKGRLSSATDYQTSWGGYTIIANYPFAISSNGKGLWRSSETTKDYITINYYNGSAQTTMANINTALSITSYNSGRYLDCTAYDSTSELYFEWDLKKDCKPVFICRVLLTGGADRHPTANFEAKKDGSDEWVTISDIVSDSAYTSDLTENYRYYRLSIKFNGYWGTSFEDSEARIYYAYLNNVPYTVSRYTNHFTVGIDFTNQSIGKVYTTSFPNSGLVTANDINGISVNRILGPNQRYILENFGNLRMMSFIQQILTGSVTLGASATYSVSCPEAKMAFVRVPDFYNEIDHWYPLFDGSSVTGYTGSSTSDSVTISFTKGTGIKITTGDISSAAIYYTFI